MIITFAILAITIVLFISGRLPSDLVALLSVLALFLAGIITTQQALAGFGDSTVILIAALFVVGEGLSRTGVTAWIGERILLLAGSSHIRLLVVMSVGTAVLSAFISNTGTVAALLPAVAAAAWRIGSVPSQFLIPLAFASNAGGLLTLTGTPPNIVVADALSAAGLQPFGFFEYGLIGAPLLLAAIIYMITFGRRLLPTHGAEDRPADLRESMGALAETFDLNEGLYRMRVRYRSGLSGKTLGESAIGHDYGVSVLRIEKSRRSGAEPYLSPLERQRQRLSTRLGQLSASAEGATMPGPDTRIEAQDVLIVRGLEENVERLMRAYDLGLQPVSEEAEQLTSTLLSSEVGIAEVLLAPRSRYIGRTVAEAQIGKQFGVQVVGIRRGDRRLENLDTKLNLGDVLLVRGKWGNIEDLRRDKRNFVVVGSPEALLRQVVELSPRSLVAVLALAGMVVLMVTGIVPTVIAALLAVVVMVVGGCVTMGQAYRAISWQSVILIAAMIPMSTALQVTGGAELLAVGLVDTLGAIGPLALLLGVFLLTTAFSQVISNTATAVLIAPIVLQAAAELDVSPYPLLMAVAVSASTAFLTPIGSPTNLMVLAPGNYRFTDYTRVGGPVLLVFMLVSLVLIPIIWPF